MRRVESGVKCRMHFELAFVVAPFFHWERSRASFGTARSATRVWTQFHGLSVGRGESGDLHPASILGFFFSWTRVQLKFPESIVGSVKPPAGAAGGLFLLGSGGAAPGKF